MLFWIRHQLSAGKELKEEQWTKIKKIMHDLLKQCEYNGLDNISIDSSPFISLFKMLAKYLIVVILF